MKEEGEGEEGNGCRPPIFSDYFYAELFLCLHMKE